MQEIKSEEPSLENSWQVFKAQTQSQVEEESTQMRVTELVFKSGTIEGMIEAFKIVEKHSAEDAERILQSFVDDFHALLIRRGGRWN